MKKLGSETFAFLLVVIALGIGGTGWYFYQQAHKENSTVSAVKNTTVKETSIPAPKSTNELFRTFKEQINIALQADRYDDAKKIFSEAPKELRTTDQFLAYSEDLNKILVAADVLKNKDSSKYDITISELALHEDSDLILKREAEDLIKQIKMAQQAEANGVDATPTAASAPTTADNTSTAGANPVDLKEILPLPDSMKNYVPNGNIEPDVNKRGRLVEILKTKSANREDDPHSLTRRLIENMHENGATLMEPRTYEYINDIAIRAYAYYVGSDFLDNLWLAQYLHDAGYTKYFLGQQLNNPAAYEGTN